MNPRWLAIWLTNWPIQRLRNAQRLTGPHTAPDERAEAVPPAPFPLLLWREDSRRGREVVAACAVCQSLGIKSSQPFHEATDLLARSGFRSQAAGRGKEDELKPETGDSRFFFSYRHDPFADREALNQVATLLQQHISPLLAIEPEPSFCGLSFDQPQTCLLNITGIGEWFGDEQAVFAAAERVLAEQGLQANMAIASTSASAWAVVHFPCLEKQGSPRSLVDSSGSEHRMHCRHLLPVAEEETLRMIGVLPTRALRLDAQTAHQLDRLGLRRIADVLELPRDGLATRLGSDLLRRLDELTGKTPQTLVMHHPAVEDSATCELEYPTGDGSILEHRLRWLVSRLTTNLAAARRGALRLSCCLEMVQHPLEVIEVGLFVPTADAEHLSRLAVAALQRRHLPSMVQRITLAVTLGGPLQQYQPTMFGDDSISQLETRRALARMIETLAGRLGRDAVVGVETSRNPLPEAAFKPRPLAGESHSTLALGKTIARRPSARRKSSSSGSSPTSDLKSPRQSIMAPAIGPLVSDPLRRPIRMFSSPQSLEVIELGSEGAPLRIRIENRICRVTCHWGPERIETGWWDGPQIRRDYYRIEIENGSWWWVFRQLGNPAPAIWKLHGQFT